jgi:hypothetical protein
MDLLPSLEKSGNDKEFISDIPFLPFFFSKFNMHRARIEVKQIPVLSYGSKMFVSCFISHRCKYYISAIRLKLSIVLFLPVGP